jgi:hypoxia-inducible factor 1-alpha inhibitor (HIF hydroxylase)
MGPAMMDEYMKFSLNAAVQFKLAGRWDAFSTNLLLVGPAGAITPAHFDEQENLFAQLNGQLTCTCKWHRVAIDDEDWAGGG